LLCSTSGRNKTLGASAHFSIFILFLAIGSSQGWQTGYATSAARDLAPRLFTALVYGKEVFTVAGHYW
jgi:aquaglyceroporin related protein